MKKTLATLAFLLLALPGWAQTITVQGTVSGTPIPITGTVTATPTGTQDVNFAQVNGSTAPAGNGVTTANTPRFVLASDNTPFTVKVTDSNGNPILNSDIVYIQGNVAHDSAISGNPLQMGGTAIAWGANPTAVTAGDATRLYADRQGVLRVLSSPLNPLTVRASLTAATSDTALVTVSSGTKIGVTSAELACSAATTVSVSFVMGFATATTPTTTSVVLAEPGTTANSLSGISRGTGAGVLGVGADGEDLRYTNSVATSGSCDIVVTYFTIES